MEIPESQSGENCKGSPRDVYLNQGQEIIMETPGYKGEFIAGCQERLSINLNRGSQELSQWRIRVEVLDMNMPCSTSSLRILEDAEKVQNKLYCDEKDTNQIFYSHSHTLDINFSNNRQCRSGGTCQGVGAQFKVSAEYVCGGTFTENGGEITSPFYPKNYPESTTCIFDIRAPKNKQVALQCGSFHLSQKCKGRCGKHTGDRDYFQDLTGGLTRYEADELKGRRLVSNNNHHTFYFISNSRVIKNTEGHYGYNCTYHFV